MLLSAPVGVGVGAAVGGVSEPGLRDARAGYRFEVPEIGTENDATCNLIVTYLISFDIFLSKEDFA